MLTTGPFGGLSVGGFFSLSSGPIHVHEAERSLDLIYKNIREKKKLLLEKAVVSISPNETERRAIPRGGGTDKCDHGTITV